VRPDQLAARTERHAVRVTDTAASRLSRLSRPARPQRPAGPPRRRPSGRLAAVAALAAATALVLSGCGQVRTGAAAVVGDQRISEASLQQLVNDSLSAPGARQGLESNFRGDVGAYRRSVLLVQVRLLVAEAAADRLGIAVDEAEIESQIRSAEQQSGGAAAFATRLAQQPVSLELYRDIVRGDVINAQIGYREGNVRRPSDGQLRAAYAEYLNTATTANLTLIRVPDAATSRRVLAQVQGDPASFGSVGAQFSPTRQPPQAENLPLSSLPADLVSRLERAERGSIFAYRLVNGGAQAFFVIRFGGINRPSFEAARPQLEAQARQQAQSEGQKYLVAVARDLGVDVNPRYGTWNPQNLGISAFVNPVIKPTATPAPNGEPPGGGDPGQQSPAPTPTPGG
jgi:hypothetical protein